MKTWHGGSESAAEASPGHGPPATGSLAIGPWPRRHALRGRLGCYRLTSLPGMQVTWYACEIVGGSAISM